MVWATGEGFLRCVSPLPPLKGIQAEAPPAAPGTGRQAGGQWVGEGGDRTRSQLPPAAPRGLGPSKPGVLAPKQTQSSRPRATAPTSTGHSPTPGRLIVTPGLHSGRRELLLQSWDCLLYCEALCTPGAPQTPTARECPGGF